MTLKASFVTIRYFTQDDPYHYTIDNRPLQDLKTCLDFLADTIDAGFTTGTLTVSTKILNADGTAAVPTYSFSAATNTGWFRSTTLSSLNATVNGGARLSISTTNVTIPSTFSYQWSTTTDASDNTTDLQLFRDAADILAHRRGTNAQTVRFYNTFTDASNYERGIVSWSVTANNFVIGTEVAGTGSTANTNVRIRTNGTDRWRFEGTTGNLFAITDNTVDIGAAGAVRPRSGYFAGRLVDGQITVTYSASMTIDASLGNDFIITATNATAFTINAPTNPVTGEFISIIIRNASGGALGAATFNAVFKMTAWTQPANANSRCIYFAYDGTSWVERGRTAADVPN